jgi:hypothetical protein
MVFIRREDTSSTCTQASHSFAQRVAADLRGYVATACGFKPLRTLRIGLALFIYP